ncbi:hypothetical protein OHA25_51770 [Nonomuraea sp. NBC_00507]|uniref:hypothetical protein n=1 Tax=Nonomuraea sp. NBC_00507 TaxID=2976002 RepID=UPI002E174626
MHSDDLPAVASIRGPGTTPLYVQVDTVRRPREAFAGPGHQRHPARARRRRPRHAQPAAHRDAYVKHPY